MRAAAQIDFGPSLFNTYELINVLVHLHADIPSNGNGHERELHMLACPKGGPEILIGGRGVVDVEDEGLAPVVADVRVPVAVVMAHRCTS